jgi:hypothetical protein
MTSFVIADITVECLTSLLHIREIRVQISVRKQFILTAAFLIPHQTNAELEQDHLTSHTLLILEIDVIYKFSKLE